MKIGVGLLRNGAASECGFHGDCALIHDGEWNIEYGLGQMDFL